jgi:hypothetical protein
MEAYPARYISQRLWQSRLLNLYSRAPRFLDLGAMSSTTSDNCTALHQFSDLFTTLVPNVTELIERCPQTCALAWGSGNPDLSGVGVFWSYTMQLAICIIFGPGYPLLHRYLDNHGRQNLSSLVVVASITTSLFAAPIAVASISYLDRHPALFDVNFLYYLNIMQFLAGMTLWNTLERGEGVEYEPQFLRVGTGAVVQGAMFAGAMFWIGRKTSQNPIIGAFVDACGNAGFAIPAPPIANPPWPPGTKKSVQDILVILIFLLSLACICLVVHYAKKISYSWCHHPRYQIAKSVLRTLASTALIGGMACCYAQMHISREHLAHLSREDFQDNAWGFGQIVALFVWLPLIVEMLIPLVLAVSSHVKEVSAGVWKRQETGPMLLPQTDVGSGDSGLVPTAAGDDIELQPEQTATVSRPKRSTW